MKGIGSADNETPLFFPGSGEDLFGVITHPTVAPLGTGVILLSGGGNIPSWNRNGLSVRIARRAAALGYHAMRIDYRGVGESTGATDGYLLADPFVGDVAGAVDRLRAAAVDRFVLIGSCFGARTCLAYSQRLDSLFGVAMVSSPVVDFRTEEGQEMPLSVLLDRTRTRKPMRGLFRIDKPRRRRESARIIKATIQVTGKRLMSKLVPGRPEDDWVSRSFVDSIEELGSRRVHTLLVYGREERLYKEFQRARHGRLGSVLEHQHDHIEVALLPGEVHAFASLPCQQAVEDLLLTWLEQIRASRDSSRSAVTR